MKITQLTNGLSGANCRSRLNEALKSLDAGDATGLTGLLTGNGSTLSATDPADFATAAQGAKADTSLQPGGALGTPASGDLQNCTFPTLNQNTTGTAGGLSSILGVASGGTGAATLAAADIAQLSELASTANAKGASLIGIEDAAGDITATTVEGALAELASAMGGGGHGFGDTGELDALVFVAATTAGVRLDLESGALAVREGDDSGYAPLNCGTFFSSSSGLFTGAIRVANQTASIGYAVTGLALGNTSKLAWCSTLQATGSVDLELCRVAADTLGLFRNGNAQTLQIYSDLGNPSGTYERLSITHNTSGQSVFNQENSGGSNGGYLFQLGGSEYFRMASNIVTAQKVMEFSTNAYPTSGGSGSASLGIASRFWDNIFTEKVNMVEQAADAANPSDGHGVFWMSNGSSVLGVADGDIVLRRNKAAGTIHNLVFPHLGAETHYSPASTGATGGSGSAGSGNQYVQLDINGTVYKVLHDGTV